MNRSALREILRRNINDPVSGGLFSDEELNDILNIAYANIQKEIRKINPEAHIFWDYINSIAGESWYPLPETFGIKRVGLKDTSASTNWSKLDKKVLDDIDPVARPVTTKDGVLLPNNQVNILGQFYARVGQWIGIFNPPTASVTNGIQLLHSPIMSMAADSDYPRIKVPTHMGIVWWAKLLAKGETDETAPETKARLAELMGDLPTWYDYDTDANERFQVVA